MLLPMYMKESIEPKLDNRMAPQKTGNVIPSGRVKSSLVLGVLPYSCREQLRLSIFHFCYHVRTQFIEL